MKKNRSFILALSIIILSSCLDDKLSVTNTSGGKDRVIDLAVPSGFDWKTTQKAFIEITSSGSAYSELYNVIEIFDKSPEEGGKLLIKGCAKTGQPFVSEITIPQYLNSVYAIQKQANGQISTKIIQLSGNKISATFSSADNSSLRSASVSSIVVPSSFDVVLKNSDTYIEATIPWNINKSMTYYVPENVTFTGAFSLDNYKDYDLTLYVKGNMNITSIISGKSINKASIIVLEGGQVTVNGNISTGTPRGTTLITVDKNASFRINGTFNFSNGMTVENYGTFTANTFDLNNSSKFYNYGKLISVNNSNITNSSIFNNYGEFTSNNLDVNTNSRFLNLGSVTINNSVTNVTNNSVLTNEGSIVVQKNFEINSQGTVVNNCHLNIGNEFYWANSTSKLIMGDGSLAEAYKVRSTGGDINMGANSIIRSSVTDLFGTILTGPTNGNSLFDVDHVFNFHSSVKFTNNIQLAYRTAENNTIVNNMNAIIKSGVTVVKGTATTAIAATSCNSGGAIIKDTDNDGVSDNLDEYPNDKNRAFNSYFPAKDKFGTYLIEDLWPTVGDYDLNDLVLKFNYQFVSNAANQVVEMIVKANPTAVGAGIISHGAGIRLDEITAAEVATVNGYSINKGNVFGLNNNGIEAGQDKVVFPVFDDYNGVFSISRGGDMINTVIGGGRGKGTPLTIKVTFNKGIESSRLSADNNINFFMIMKESQVSRKEIHLPNFAPTTLATKSYFGKEDDDTNLSVLRYYRSKPTTSEGYLMWGLMIPDDFSYPYERTDIMKAYLKFQSWAESGGKLYKDWFLINSSEYRNNEKIYKEN